MDKRYQIFISSTFEDLKQARQLASETVLDMRHMPVGMEQFPASPEEQFSYIKRIIDSSDYYILIIGGKYGSVSPETQISYTEMEYDYAIKKGIPVLAFIRRFEAMQATEIEQDSNKKQKLEAFTQKIGKLAVLWNKPEELSKKIMQSLNEVIENFPRIGWVRADKVASETLTAEQNTLLKENKSLQKKVGKLKAELGENSVIDTTAIAGLDDTTEINVSYAHMYDSRSTRIVLLTWKEIFLSIAPDIQNGLTDSAALSKLGKFFERFIGSYFFCSPDDRDFQTIRIQFEALKLITYSDSFWRLTPKGKQIMYQGRVVRKPQAEQSLET